MIKFEKMNLGKCVYSIKKPSFTSHRAKNINKNFTNHSAKSCFVSATSDEFRVDASNAMYCPSDGNSCSQNPSSASCISEYGGGMGVWRLVVEWWCGDRWNGDVEDSGVMVWRMVEW